MKLLSVNTMIAMAVMGFVSMASAQDSMESKEVNANFDQVRSAGYGFALRGNPIAAYSVADYLVLPNLVGGNHFAYLEPGKASVRNGMVSASLGGKTYFGHIARSADNNGLASLGFANDDQSLGFGVRFSADLETKSKDSLVTTTNANGTTTGTESESSTLFHQGGQIGLFLGVKTGSSTVYGSVDYSSHGEGLSTKAVNKTGAGFDLAIGLHSPSDVSTSDFGLKLRVKPSETKTETTIPAVGATPASINTTTTVDESSRWGATAHYNYGRTLASGSDFRVIAGANNRVDFNSYADIKQNRKNTSDYAVVIQPNFGAEYAFTESFLVFGGFSQDITIAGSAKDVPNANGDNVKSESGVGAQSAQSQADFGFRYQTKRFAFETVLHEDIWDGGLGQLFSNGTNIMTQSSVIVNF